MAKTRLQLVNRALSTIGVLQAGQSASAEDVELVEAAIEAKVADLAARRIFYVADTDDIDDAAFQWLAILVGQDIAPDFSAPMDGGAIAVAERMLRMQNAQEPTYEHVRAEYF